MDSTLHQGTVAGTPQHGYPELGHRKQGGRAERLECLYYLCPSQKCFYLLSVFRARLNYPELKRAVRQQYDLYRPSRILIEDKASGTPLIQDLKAGSLYQVTGYLPPTGTDKIMRLHSQTAKFENGLVFLPEEAPWLFEYQRELLSFPGCKYDDQVDSTTQALDYFNTYSSLDAWEGL